MRLNLTQVRLAICLCLAGVFSGCGSSQQDLFLKHAQRDRGNTSTESEEAPQTRPKSEVPAESDVTSVAVAVKPVSVKSNESATGNKESIDPTPDVVKADEPNGDDTDASLADQVGVQPISKRKPEAELSVAERRKRAFENLQKINEALILYLTRNGHYPKSYRTNEGGVPTLSWRVELLPYLGYQELYDKFDFSRAWNMPPNKELLQYIPDAYVSPERFDEKTNYLLPIDSAFIFGANRGVTAAMIDDGPENTIMLVEVNDRHAVNWTEPKDFEPKSPMQMSPYLGKLREDGTFALWANGFPVLLETGLSDAQLFQAMTYAKGDALQARDIHRAITVEEAEDDPILGEDSVSGEMGEQELRDAQTPGNTGLQLQIAPEETLVKREPVPPVPELSAAQAKLREIYREKISEATDSSDKAKLAGEMIATAETLEADPAGAYVLQRAALTLAVDAADAKELLKAIDQRVARFEVDSFEENLRWIQEFGEATASRDGSTVDGDSIVKRAIPVIYAGIRADQYMPSSLVARIANRFTDNSIEDNVSRLLTRLRSQLGSAKREYDKSVEDLEQYRIDPENKAAGAAVGRFLCFVKGDWEKGLPLIAEGPGGDLAEVARMDLRGAQRAIDQAAIGDAWWDLSERGNGIYRQGAQDRAVMWYTQAFERLPESLDRIHVKNRLQEADETDGRSPIALCLQLAEELGVDLNQSLTTIAAKGSRSARRDDDDN